MSACDPFLPDDLVYPRRPSNRPALPRIGYRLGGYGEILESMLRGIDASVELSAWTHRESDDPGIALLEAAALVGEVLTFYQERYANEAFLRTANWRESVSKLVRLLGYRPAPGLGGRGTFALEAKGDRPVEVPGGFPIKAQLEGIDEPVDFLTTDTVTAWPHLSRFHLYRRRTYSSTIPSGTVALELSAVDGDGSAAAAAAAGLRAGDTILLVRPEPEWATSGTSFSADQSPSQTVKVKTVTTALGRTTLTLEAPLVRDWSGPVTAYRVNRSFRHFGHNAPLTYTVNVSTSGVISGASEEDTDFERHGDTTHDCSLLDLVEDLPPDTLPLDRQVDDLAPGGTVIVEMRLRDHPASTRRWLTTVRTVRGVTTTSLASPAISGPSTVLELDQPLNRNVSLDNLRIDVRDVRMHEATSAALTLRRTPTFSGAGFATGVDALDFFGTLEEVRAMSARRLLLEKEGEEPLELVVADHADDFTLPAGAAADEPRMWTLSFDRAPSPFTRADFDEDAPTVTVSGNLVDADQGRDRGEAVLGNGDARAAFQTFPLPAAPLTWLPDAGATPPRRAELEIRVQGRLWTRVDTFFGRGPKDEVYIVREDEEGASYVQFGNGETGARLPSGVKNVTAAYRTGVGAHGPAEQGKGPTAGRRLDGLDKIRLPGRVTGGTEPEPTDTAREAAPGKVQGLGRLVSLRDFETEALGVGGVTAATAAWDLHNGVPSLVLRVLMEAGRAAEFEAARATLQTWQRCRGADRFPVVIEQATLRYAWLDLRYAPEPVLAPEEVEDRIRSALGLVGDDAAARTGLFGLHARRLGAPEHARRIEAVVQNVEGVTWCGVEALGLFAAGATEPETLTLPTSPRTRAGRLSPAPSELLQVHPAHLVLTTAPPPPGGECDA